MDLCQPKTIGNNILTFISTSNQNNSKIFDLVKSGVNTLVENNVNVFKNIKLIHAKRQPPNLKRILKNFLFTNNTTGLFKYSGSRCLYLKSPIGLKTFVNDCFKNENDMWQ